MATVKAYKAKASKGILLNANENYQNVEKETLEKIKKGLSKVDFNRYPDNDAKELKELYAKTYKIKPTQIIFGNGSDEMLGLMIALHIKKGDSLLTVNPDFSMYDYYVSMQGGKMVKMVLKVGEPLPVDAFIEKGKKEKVKCVILSNPNNPYGSSYPKKDVIKIIEAFAPTPVVVDEAYGEFNDYTMIHSVEKYKNVFVTRTLSKVYGLAGIRCGVLIGNAKAIQSMQELKVPYNVNVLTQLTASIVLKDTKKMETYVKEISERRDAFLARVNKKGYTDVTLYPSKTNYVFGESKKKDVFLKNLKKNQIEIRNYPDATSFRITIGSASEMAKVAKVLDETFGG